MPEDERENNRGDMGQRSDQELWKTQEQEKGLMHITTEQVRARARGYDLENAGVYWAVVALAPLFAAWIIYDMRQVFHTQPGLLVAARAWVYLTFYYAIAGLIRKGPRRMLLAEPCAQFLRREFEGKRQTALGMRRWIFLLGPPVLAAWWASGREPLPAVVGALVIAFASFASSNRVRRCEQEIEKLGNSR